MDREWNDNQPIYRQLRDRLVAMILDKVLKEGDPLPSVRNVAAEYRVNPLTVLKGYQQLVDEGLVETKRGRGMFINAGARSLLLQGERQKFLGEEWPWIYATIQRLGLKPEELLQGDGAQRDSGPHSVSRAIEGARARSLDGARSTHARCLLHCRCRRAAALDTGFAGARLCCGRASAIRSRQGGRFSGQDHHPARQ